MLDATAFLRSLFDTAVAAATPANCMQRWLPRRPSGNIVVIGAGKAAAAMARQLEERWGAPMRGVVVVPAGHDEDCRFVKVRLAAHPIPDESCVSASKEVLEAVAGLAAQDTVVCLLSGGGSSLLTLPLPGIELADKQRITQALLRSGAAIHEINCVRTQLSAIKGGRLAMACAPATVITLVISDVQGNDVAVVASGPTAASSATTADATSILERYGIPVGNNITEAMRELAIALAGHPAVHALAADTDGIDGGGDNAGCFVTPDTIARAQAAAIEALECQRNNDSYAFFAATGGLLKTGPTKTNVNDFRAILIT